MIDYRYYRHFVPCSVLITSKVHTHSFLGYKTYLKQKAIDLYSDHCTIF